MSAEESAYPQMTDGGFTRGGMSLRDYFAAAALTGLLASPNATLEWITKYSVVSAYAVADAMLEARKKS